MDSLINFVPVGWHSEWGSGWYVDPTPDLSIPYELTDKAKELLER